MRQWWVGVGLAGLLTACGSAVAPSAGGRPAPLPPALPTQAIETAVVRLVAQARARTAWAAAPKTVAPTLPGARTTSPPPSAAPAPTTHVAGSTPTPALMAMRDVPVHDPVSDYTSAPVAGQLFGFVTTIDPAADTATIGPGWMWEQPPGSTTGQFVNVYPGGTITLPASIPTSATTAPGWPGIWVTFPNTDTASNPPGPDTATIVVSNATTPPEVACTAVYGQQPCATYGGELAWVGESASGPGWSVSTTQPTWIPVTNMVPGLTWSGSSYGVGTPTLTPTAP